jgi:hypothetical protein
MPRLPSIKVTPVPESQRGHLLEWFQEWHIKTVSKNIPLEFDSSPPPEKTLVPHPDEPLSSHVAEYDSTISVGDIRLLSPGILGLDARMTYVAVLQELSVGEENHERSFLVAPYSPFSVPATRGELLTGREDSDLRVLILWGARSIFESQIRESWAVDTLGEVERGEALTIWKNVAFGRDIPTELIDRVGAPIARGDDPRIQYQEEELKIFSPLSSLSFDGNTEVDETGADPSAGAILDFKAGLLEHREFLNQLPLAASGEPKAGKTRATAIPGTDLYLRQQSFGRSLLFAIVTNSGPLTELDGSVLVNKDGRESEPFKGGQLPISDGTFLTAERLILRKPDGEEIQIL